MNSPARTLIITAIITLFVATLVPAQPASQAPAAGPASPSRVQAAGTAAEPSSAGTNRRLGTATPGQPPNEGVPAVSSTGFRSVSRSGTSYGYSQSSSSGTSSSYRSSSRRAPGSKRQVFIIPSEEIEREDHLAIERDIHVMSHILDKVLKKPVSKIGGVFTVMDDFFGRDSHVTQVIYAAGYGAMFFMEVDFALVGPSPDPEAKEPNEPKEKVDTAWEQAERELFAPHGVTAFKSLEPPVEQQYDPEKVELLKRNVVETLKHAANIRALKSDESVILTIVGRAVIPTSIVYGGKKIEWSFSSDNWVPSSEDYETAPYPPLLPSVLTIRAKKSDIDAFSKGELDFTAFYARTQLLANWSVSADTTQTSAGRFEMMR